jgi:hypothetical protein
LLHQPALQAPLAEAHCFGQMKATCQIARDHGQERLELIAPLGDLNDSRRGGGGFE